MRCFIMAKMANLGTLNGLDVPESPLLKSPGNLVGMSSSGLICLRGRTNPYALLKARFMRTDHNHFLGLLNYI